MKIQRLDVTDLVAGVFVAAATVVYVAGLAGAELGGARARASVVFLCGMLACGIGARRDAFQGQGAESRFVAVLTAFGVATLIVGVTAIILASEGYLAALFVGIVALWLGATTRHLLVQPVAVSSEATQPRELVRK